MVMVMVLANHLMGFLILLTMVFFNSTTVWIELLKWAGPIDYTCRIILSPRSLISVILVSFNSKISMLRKVPISGSMLLRSKDAGRWIASYISSNVDLDLNSLEVKIGELEAELIEINANDEKLQRTLN
ncbi:hypothetical protein LWI28_023543 [Acer negundo]|uniref:Uncharacterized protein n=1 Tax=Acer negundo TaxID=4023 RepID=A0AAD5IW55_ACENE|nr:hypothetical protein LWI28_023543 [Acer negundo]